MINYTEIEKFIVIHLIKINLVQLFYKYLYNLPRSKNNRFHGYEGYFIENKFGIKPNSNNSPDILGFELKKQSDKISFGDWSPTKFAFEIPNSFIKYREDFFRIFGNFNENKNRYSWSGKCIPKYGEWNYNGTILKFNKNGDLKIKYNFKKDTRKNKYLLIPKKYRNVTLKVAYWTKDKLQEHIENKFNINGFIIINHCNNKYNGLSFGRKINFELFCELIKQKYIIFDPGMYQGNNRKYCQFRAYQNIWNKLIINQLV